MLPCAPTAGRFCRGQQSAYAGTAIAPRTQQRPAGEAIAGPSACPTSPAWRRREGQEAGTGTRSPGCQAILTSAWTTSASRVISTRLLSSTTMTSSTCCPGVPTGASTCSASPPQPGLRQVAKLRPQQQPARLTDVAEVAVDGTLDPLAWAPPRLSGPLLTTPGLPVPGRRLQSQASSHDRACPASHTRPPAAWCRSVAAAWPCNLPRYTCIPARVHCPGAVQRAGRRKRGSASRSPVSG